MTFLSIFVCVCRHTDTYKFDHTYTYEIDYLLDEMFKYRHQSNEHMNNVLFWFINRYKQIKWLHLRALVFVSNRNGRQFRNQTLYNSRDTQNQASIRWWHTYWNIFLNLFLINPVIWLHALFFYLIKNDSLNHFTNRNAFNWEKCFYIASIMQHFNEVL